MTAARPTRPLPRRESGSAQTDLPLVLSVLADQRDLVDHAHRLAGVLTEGDFEALVIWCELSRHCSAEGAQAHAVPLHDIVTATAIPRETVRRKLERLAALGHVARMDRGWVLRAAPRASVGCTASEAAADRIRDALAPGGERKTGGAGAAVS